MINEYSYTKENNFNKSSIYFFDLPSDFIRNLFLKYLLRFHRASYVFIREFLFFNYSFWFIFYFLKKENLFLKTSLLLFFANLIISIYHSFLERGLVASVLVVHRYLIQNIEDLREMLNNMITKCDEITFSVLGLSLANINTILIIGLIYINFYLLLSMRKLNKKIRQIIRVNHAGELAHKRSIIVR